jgi:hypothetical protein
LGVVHGIFWVRTLDVIGAVEEFGSKSEGKGVTDHGVDEEVRFGAVDDVRGAVET